MKPALLRPQAEDDLVEIAQYYAREGGTQLGERLIDAAIAALKPLERMPQLGSPRLGIACEIPGLRAWRVSGFPLQWFYFEAAESLDVVRLLGDRQDIIAILSGAE
ncbi:type II toxin-antitoxin system RelE/ParE family toxin [Ramlibacter albus]|uniref:Type II toxin-antitoxin system RelE/ParE family toxin n=1 Tax=Ramlibacter albus TaxID=2079448 RepID=A0A923M5J2_9BURK|nr:type II toxin-antitoxin system RelE/ParE family toxin [Ramlibacter albus]MBC5764221.1 type II toxin-antitoxin system RelE/ParE family toxin [Ramlibacter albus]